MHKLHVLELLTAKISLDLAGLLDPNRPLSSALQYVHIPHSSHVDEHHTIRGGVNWGQPN